MTNIPLGEPELGQNGAPTKAFDQTPRTRRAFSYQDYAAYALLLKSIDGGPYKELWVEHHNDILAARQDGLFDLYQVKTREPSDEPWMIGDDAIYETIAKFCTIQKDHGNEIAAYYIYSNLRPYVPAPNASASRKSRSLHALQHEIFQSGVENISDDYRDAFLKLKKATCSNEDILCGVLKKLFFVVGPALDSFRSGLPAALCEVRPKLTRWRITEVMNLQLELLRRVEAAGSAEVPPLLLHTSPISAGGLPSAEIYWRRVRASAIRRNISLRMLQRRFSRVFFAVGKVAVCVVAGGLLFRPLLQVSALQSALNVIQRSQNGVRPAEFAESVAIVRAARKPLNHLSLDGANIECQDLSGLEMVRASGQSMHATGVTFDNSILAGAVFNDSELNGAKFRHARMDEIVLSKSNMLVTNFSGAEAKNANFSEATLNGANFSHGVFSGANFKNAVLDSSDMRSADLSMTNLKDAVLTDADVSWADFTGAKNLTQEMLLSACVSSSKLPIVDKPLKPTSRACYKTEKEEEQRMVKRFALLVTGQVAVIQGYCKDFEHKFRPADSKLHPQDNERIWFDTDVLGDQRPH